MVSYSLCGEALKTYLSILTEILTDGPHTLIPPSVCWMLAGAPAPTPLTGSTHPESPAQDPWPGPCPSLALRAPSGARLTSQSSCYPSPAISPRPHRPIRAARRQPSYRPHRGSVDTKSTLTTHTIRPLPQPPPTTQYYPSYRRNAGSLVSLGRPTVLPSNTSHPLATAPYPVAPRERE